ncbi:DUF2502 domain-containing protein [Pantoea sp. SM3640]|uniref:DUF2502 domain-containing protein n=1 Tax=Pantoea sp. SM3640 TaxID=2787629 RepID=UPI0018A6D913|nr:DUF2502 domain-containing protein [Pantoea sp. SM3640]QPG28097.1 DUF2502 domain-containing protein [Pantoea sp. SM3640]
MKRALIFAALLAVLSPLANHTAEASSASITLAPGVTLNLGDRDNRGYYWDGSRWREPRWWNDRYSYNERRWWRHEEWRRQQQWERERRWHERDRERRWEHQHRRDRDWDRHDRRGPGPRGFGPGGPDHHGHDRH